MAVKFKIKNEAMKYFLHAIYFFVLFGILVKFMVIAAIFFALFLTIKVMYNH
ncbi:MAG: hypothetical protein K9J77_11130 [Rhodoferax sp.]|nr:hypothetical protein [Rhodoferax sp.]